MKTILIADDEEDIRITIKTILESEGYKVIEAKNGTACLKTIKEKKPDLVLLDIMMPGTPSEEIIQKAKSAKIVYFSAKTVTDEDIKELTKPTNVKGFIKKPFDVKSLVKEIKKHAK